MTTSYQPQLELAKAAALEAGKIISSYCKVDSTADRSSKLVDIKANPVDLVTEVDKRVEVLITKLIRKAFPDDVIIGEEDQADSPNGGQDDPFPTDRCWCVDPIDGTTNFVHNYPFVAVSIGYMDRGVPRVGVIYNPITESMYEASEGKGAYLNGKKISIDSDASSVKDCLLVNNIGHYRHEDFVDESAERVKKWLKAGLRGYRASGSAAQNLAHVATGKMIHVDTIR